MPSATKGLHVIIGRVSFFFFFIEQKQPLTKTTNKTDYNKGQSFIKHKRIHQLVKMDNDMRIHVITSSLFVL